MLLLLRVRPVRLSFQNCLDLLRSVGRNELNDKPTETHLVLGIGLPRDNDNGQLHDVQIRPNLADLLRLDSAVQAPDADWSYRVVKRCDLQFADENLPCRHP